MDGGEPPGYSGESTLAAPAHRIEMEVFHGGGLLTDHKGGLLTDHKGGLLTEETNSSDSDSYEIKTMVGGDEDGDEDDDTELIQTVLSIIIASAIDGDLSDVKTRKLSSGQRVRVNLPDSDIEKFLDYEDPGFMFDEEELFESFMFKKRGVGLYLKEHLPEYIQFWRDFTNLDGTDFKMRFTDKRGEGLSSFLKEVHTNHLQDLVKSVGALLSEDEKQTYYDAPDQDTTLEDMGLLEPNPYRSTDKYAEEHVKKHKPADIVSEYNVEEHNASVKEYADSSAKLEADFVTADGIIAKSLAANNQENTISVLVESRGLAKGYGENIRLFGSALAKIIEADKKLDGLIQENDKKLFSQEGVKTALEESSADPEYIFVVQENIKKYSGLKRTYAAYSAEIKEAHVTGNALKSRVDAQKIIFDEMIAGIQKRLTISAAAKAAAPAAPAGSAPAAAPAAAPAPVDDKYYTYEKILKHFKDTLKVIFKSKDDTGATIVLRIPQQNQARTDIIQLLEEVLEKKRWSRDFKQFYDKDPPGEVKSFAAYLETEKPPKLRMVVGVKEQVNNVDKFNKMNLKEVIRLLLYIQGWTGENVNDIAFIFGSFLEGNDDLGYLDIQQAIDMGVKRGGGKPKRVTRRLPKLKNSTHFSRRLKSEE